MVIAGSGRRDGVEDQRSEECLQTYRSLHQHPFLLHRRPGGHRPDVPELPQLVHQPFRHVHREGSPLRRPGEAHRQPQEVLHVLPLLQHLPLPLREGQGVRAWHCA